MKKIISLALIMMAIVSLSSCGAPASQDDSYVGEGGGNNNVQEWAALFCTYSFEKSEYKIEDAFFTLYFGAALDSREFGISGDMVESQKPIVVRMRNSGKEIILHEFSPDEIFQEEYDCYFDENNRMVYNHSENVKLSQELLVGTKGSITIHITQLEDGDANALDYGTSVAVFYYSIENGIVTFSNKNPV